MFIKIDQDEHDAGGGAGGAGASQDGGIAGAAAEARAAGGEGPAAQAGADINAAKPGAGQPGDTNQAAATDQHEIVWNGQKKMMTLQELKDYAQRAYNVTQGEQANSKTRKELTAQLARLEQMIAEAEKNGKPPDESENDPLAKLSKAHEATRQELAGLREKSLVQDWERGFAPVQQKYPDISEKALFMEFQEKVQAGEVEDTVTGLMKTAEGMAAEREGIVNKRLDGLLLKSDDPRMKAYKEKLIADYVAGKLKLTNAGGENPKGAAGGKLDTESSISDVAAKLRSAG